MQVPSELKPLCWGAVIGGAALWIIGFTYGGWTTASTAESQAKQRADRAVVAALAPICADKFRQQANAPANLVELNKVSTWQQGSFVEKGGWATMPGSTVADAAVATACAELLRIPKS
jgi:alpha/beta superfamily hydrolase